MTMREEPGTSAPAATPDMVLSERSLFGLLGGTLLALGLRSRSTLGTLLLGGAGAGLGYLAWKGSNPVAPALKIEVGTDPGEVVVRDAVTIARPVSGLYEYWRRLENLPRLMSHLESVEVLDGNRSKWTVKAPLGQHVSWEAERTAEEQDRRIAWQSLPGSMIENSGEVLFREAPGARGTEIVVRLSYRPPLGTTGAVIARAFGQEPAQQLRDDLMRFKREQELGFNPTTNGQTSGRPDAGKAMKDEGPKAGQDQQGAEHGAQGNAARGGTA